MWRPGSLGLWLFWRRSSASQSVTSSALPVSSRAAHLRPHDIDSARGIVQRDNLAVAEQPSVATKWWGWMRVVILAGVPAGMLVVGVGSRLAMLLLRVTSPETVRGVESDDGFIIGRFTVGGSYALIQIGAFVGLLGAALYLLIRHWLLGPHWFRYLTIGLGSGAVGGSFLLHSDGVDFRVLQPSWLAMALFVAVPALFGMAIGPAVEMIARRPMPAGWQQFAAPAVILAIGPAGIIPALFVAPGLFVYVAAQTPSHEVSKPLPAVIGAIVRALWLAIAVAGLLALISDIRAINRLN